ncbi:hypothetical protein [Haloarcula montana]|uniref:hypothetical protein n=1 Tax=Haloarcula montana TaxID=3111776 RepID=UPI002D777EFC|nr:hypothetical protein [Haloarcula sp. GH36]
MRLSTTERRLLWLGTALVGVIHLLVPGLLLRTARFGYRTGLAVEFRPRSGARKRVRAVGVGLLALAAVVRRLQR